MGTKKILEQIQDLENRIITERVSQKLPQTILLEMKKIGIEKITLFLFSRGTFHR